MNTTCATTAILPHSAKGHLVDEVLNEERYDEKVEYRIHVALVSLKEDLKQAGDRKSTRLNSSHAR